MYLKSGYRNENNYWVERNIWDQRFKYSGFTFFFGTFLKKSQRIRKIFGYFRIFKWELSFQKYRTVHQKASRNTFYYIYPLYITYTNLGP